MFNRLKVKIAPKLCMLSHGLCSSCEGFVKVAATLDELLWYCFSFPLGDLTFDAS